MQIGTVLLYVGFGLLILGGASGVALFMGAISREGSIFRGPGASTLWGLFLIGLLAGLMLIAASNAYKVATP